MGAIPVSVLAEDGRKFRPATVLPRFRARSSKTKDITGGLPRVAELFEARKPKECAVVTEIDGEVVEFGPITSRQARGDRHSRGWRRSGEYLIPKGKHVSVHEGDRVLASGEALMDGLEPARHPEDQGR